jgi:hypothetical protein
MWTEQMLCHSLLTVPNVRSGGRESLASDRHSRQIMVFEPLQQPIHLRWLRLGVRLSESTRSQESLEA